ncbi:MAG: DUF6580 family putative transport protein [Planctomycetota bacterium]
MSNTPLRPLLLAAGWTAIVKVLPYALNRFGLSLDAESSIYPWNFSPLVALAVVGGYHLPRLSQAVALPVLGWFLADLFLLTLIPLEWVVYPGLVFTYAAMAAAAACGRFGSRAGTPGLVASSVAGVLIFFAVSNFGVWATGAFGLYSRDLAGLVQCYEAALPFLRNSVVATACFVPLLAVTTQPQPATAGRPSLTEDAFGAPSPDRAA